MLAPRRSVVRGERVGIRCPDPSCPCPPRCRSRRGPCCPRPPSGRACLHKRWPGRRGGHRSRARSAGGSSSRTSLIGPGASRWTAGPRWALAATTRRRPASASLFKRPSSRAKSSTCSNPLYTLAKRTAATSSSSLRPSSTASPSCSLCTSGPSDQAVCSTAAASASSCSGSTGRFLHAARAPAITLRRSKGSRWPDRLTTQSTAWFRRSTVVNRRLHETHSRRRRMASPCSTSRESTTRSSVAPHHGQRTT